MTPDLTPNQEAESSPPITRLDDERADQYRSGSARRSTSKDRTAAVATAAVFASLGLVCLGVVLGADARLRSQFVEHLATILVTLTVFAGFLTAYFDRFRDSKSDQIYKKLENTTSPRTSIDIRGENSGGVVINLPLPPGVEEVSQLDELRMADLWDQAQTRLDLYHQLARSQAKTSFLMLMAVATLGFGLLAIVVWQASQATTTAGSVVAGTVGGLGTVLATYIGRTFQSTYRESTSRLVDYFSQPLEITRLLSAERMLSRLTKTASEEGVLMIIDSALSPTRNSNRHKTNQGQQDENEPNSTAEAH